jgi:hypothetical protein
MRRFVERFLTLRRELAKEKLQPMTMFTYLAY